MIPEEIYKLKSLLDSFLGDSKKELDETYQLQYSCPRCREYKGKNEDRKKNLEVNIKLGCYQCWSCSQYDDDMHGSILKLIKLYGNDSIVKEYKDTLYSFKQSKLYNISFDKNDFNIENSLLEKKEVKLPNNFVKFEENKNNNEKALNYLKMRGIDWDIINDFNIGYTTYDENNKQISSRIILPSFNKYGELNYWTGRDFLNKDKRQKYFNPKTERKDLIFNEDKIQWDADITLVEGPFDHIVVPNSIPLLGKALNNDFKLYNELMKNSNANINIWLDSDCPENSMQIYKLLNHGRLYNKIRIINSNIAKDPSDIYNTYGKKGIISCLKQTSKIVEYKLM